MFHTSRQHANRFNSATPIPLLSVCLSLFLLLCDFLSLSLSIRRNRGKNGLPTAYSQAFYHAQNCPKTIFHSSDAGNQLEKCLNRGHCGNNMPSKWPISETHLQAKKKMQMYLLNRNQASPLAPSHLAQSPEPRPRPRALKARRHQSKVVSLKP